MATHDAKLGIGLETGMFFHAPAGTALPESPAATLPNTWEEIGDISADGITLTFEKSTTNIRNWANVLKRILMTEHAETVNAPIMDTKREVLEAVLGEDAVTTTAATSTHGAIVKAALSQASLPPERAYLFLMKDEDDLIGLGCTNGQITAMDAVSFAPGSTINWSPTITALGSGWQLILDDGQTA